MNLYAKLKERKDHPLRLGLIGAGKFAAMYLAQVPKTPGIHLVGIADLSPDNAKQNLERVGWKPAVFSAPTLDAALKYESTHLCSYTARGGSKISKARGDRCGRPRVPRRPAAHSPRRAVAHDVGFEAG